MAWTAYALGAETPKNIISVAADIISEKLGEFVYDSSANTCTYTFKGVTYTIQATNSTTSSSSQYVLSLNADTGEFCIGCKDALGSGADAKRYISAAIFLLQTESGTEVLAPVDVNISTSQKLYEMFTGSYASTASATNYSTHFVMMPVCTNYFYSSNVGYRYKLVVNMFTTNGASVAAGTTIQVGGQNFLCVAPTLFEKL